MDGNGLVGLPSENVNENNPADSTAYDLTISTAAPTQTIDIHQILDDVNPQIGDIGDGGWTNDQAPTLTGTIVGAPLIAGDTIHIVRTGSDGSSVEMTVPAANVVGLTWTYQDSGLADGVVYHYQAQVVNSAGIGGDWSTDGVDNPMTGDTAGYDIHTDTTPPAQTPIIQSAFDDQAPGVGHVFDGGVTNDHTPELHGTCTMAIEANQHIEIFLDGVYVGDAVMAANDKDWTFTAPGNLGVGPHQYVAQIVDKAGGEGPKSENPGNGSPAFDLTVSAPPVLQIQDVGITEPNGDTGMVTVMIKVTLDTAGINPISIDWTTVDGAEDFGGKGGLGISEFGALSNGVLASDYVAANGTITFLPGEVEQWISVQVKADAIDEWDQDFFIELTPQDPTQLNAMGNDFDGTVTISDEDATMTVVGSGANWTMPDETNNTTVKWAFTTDKVAEKSFTYTVELKEGDAIAEIADAEDGVDFIAGTYTHDYDPLAGLSQAISEAVILPEGATDTLNRDFLATISTSIDHVLADPTTSQDVMQLNSYGGIWGPLWNDGNDAWALGGPGSGAHTALLTDHVVHQGDMIYLWDIFSENGTRMLKMGAGDDIVELGDNNFGANQQGIYTLDGGNDNDTMNAQWVTEAGGKFVRFTGGNGNDIMTGTNRIGTMTDLAAISTFASMFMGLDTTGFDKRLAGDVFSGGNGNDTIDGGAGADFIVGGTGNDTLTGGTQDDTLIGEVGKDTLIGGDGADYLDGGTHDDVIRGGQGADIIIGGFGVDTTDYSDSNDAVTVDLVSQTGSGGDAAGDTFSEVENIIGSDGDDVLIGNDRKNKIDGGKGDDLLVGGVNADELIGGDDTDTVSYQNSAGNVTVNLLTNKGLFNDAEGDEYGSIENVIGADGNDVLIGNNQKNKLEGGKGDDLLIGGADGDALLGDDNNDTVSYQTSAGNVTVDLLVNQGMLNDAAGDTYTSIENIIGSNATGDILIGDNKDNIIQGLAGADHIDGKGGNNTVSYSMADGKVGIDLASGQGVWGHADGDTLIGIQNAIGSDFDDAIIASSVANAIDGGLGSDKVSYASSGSGVTVDLSTGVTAGAAAGDKLTSIENLQGSTFSDTLTGNAGQNLLEGGDDNDTLAGGGSADTLDGGKGLSDTASYASSSDPVIVKLGDAQPEQGGDAAGDTLTGIENITGTDGNDILWGATGANILNGGDGNDELRGVFTSTPIGGAVVNDTLNGGAGDDIVDYSYNVFLFDGTKGPGFSIDLDTGFAWCSQLASTDDILISIEGVRSVNHVIDLITASNVANQFFLDTDTPDYPDAVYNVNYNPWSLGYLGIGTSNPLMSDIVTYDRSTDGIHFTATGGMTLSGTGGYAQGDMITGAAYIQGSTHADSFDLTALILSDDVSFTLQGGGGADSFIGRNFYDVVSYESVTLTDSVNITVDGQICHGGAAEGDTIVGIHYIIGSGSDDVIDISALTTSGGGIFGGNGDDRLIGSVFADSLNGGNGLHDFVSYLYTNADVTVNLANHTAFITAVDQDALHEIEDIRTGNGADTLIGDTEDNTFEGGGGADIYVGGGGVDTVSFKHASLGGVNASLILGVGSNNDAAGDTYTNIQNLIGTDFSDTLDGNSKANIIHGGGSADTIHGFDDDDLLFGEAGSDTLDGGAGNDEMNGGAGADTYIGEGIDTVSFAGALLGVSASLSLGIGLSNDAAGDTYTGIRNFIGSDGSDTLEGNNEDNNIKGGGSDDILHGLGGLDSLLGGDGNDTLDGGAGQDFLHGDAGSNNNAWGGADGDTFFLSTNNSYGFITIHDFVHGEDQLRSENYSFGIGFDDYTFSQQGGGTLVQFNGSDVAFLVGISAVTAADF